jgi:type II secretion system protein I
LNHPSYFSQHGFTLTEVLVALAILGVVVGAGFDALQVSSRCNRVAADASIIVLLCRNKIEELQLEEISLGEKSGTFPKPWSQFAWKVKINTTGLNSTYRFSVQINGQGQNYSMEEYFFYQKP